MLRLASLASALVLVGCASQGDEGMTVINNTAIAGTSCIGTGASGQPFRSHGEINAFSSAGYVLTPLIQSRITTGVDEEQIDPLQKTIFFRGADVTLTLKATQIETIANGAISGGPADMVLDQFAVLFSGSLPPNGSANINFEVIPPITMRTLVQSSGVDVSTQRLRAEVLAEVTIRGDLGGDEVSSNTFAYPISVCTDCVVNYTGVCPMTGTPRTGNPCNMFQDGVVDCCSVGEDLVCPATTM